MHNRPSRTAQSVATNVLFLSYDPILGQLVPPEVAIPTRWFLEAAVGGFALLFDIPLFRAYARRVERKTLPGISVHNVIRKRWIEDKVREALTSACSQVVILGAGYDTLAYRLHRQFPQVRWWEIDHPATQSRKRAALDRHGSVQGNLRLIPVDFTEQTLSGVLRSTQDFDHQAGTIFIAEGLLMYLTDSEIDELMQTVHEYGGPLSYLIGTALEPAPDGRLIIQGASERVNKQLQRVGEPFRWGITRAALPTFLKSYSFSAKEVVRVRDVLPSYITAEHANIVLPEGEYLFCAERQHRETRRYW